MQNSIDPFALYAQNLINLGHDRHWIRANEPALRKRFEMDATPFPPLPESQRAARDRYEEI